ncbi:MAG: hypothetical protein UIT85_09890 [Treponema sp.]|nr:hypothetical protein [Treponema sp.]
MKTIKTLTVIALAAVIAFAFTGCSQDAGDPPAHVHAYSDSWTSNETHHWHAATCEHDVKKDLDVHSAAAELGKDATGHWKVCGVCNASFETTSHTWDHEDFQIDAVSGKEIKTCTVCGFVVDKNHAHTEDNGTVTTAPTCVTKGIKTYKCSMCKVVLRTEEQPELYSSPIDAETGLATTNSSKYIYFGVFPKTVAAENITVDENVSVTMGANTYYKGKNDENYYVKVKENAYNTGTEYKYSDGTQAKQSVQTATATSRWSRLSGR